MTGEALAVVLIFTSKGKMEENFDQSIHINHLVKIHGDILMCLPLAANIYNKTIDITANLVSYY